jgi:hypothetical protein
MRHIQKPKLSCYGSENSVVELCQCAEEIWNGRKAIDGRDLARETRWPRFLASLAFTRSGVLRGNSRLYVVPAYSGTQKGDINDRNPTETGIPYLASR